MASGHGPQFPPNISNALITNSTITNVNGNAYFHPSERHELDLLRSKVSVAALHNSGERYDAPRCHPGTRIGVQADIMRWLDDVDDPELVFWMYGSAGVGKSAIAQAIATLCYDSKPRRLAGAFFLSRTAPAESGRGDEKRLVATLAYQMTINIPNFEVHVAAAIARNRLVFDLDLETQIRELIIHPLSELSNDTSNKIPTMIFILDALDECSPTSSQQRIVKAFVAAMEKMQHRIPHRLLIASRPETNISSIFAAPEISPFVRSVSLDNNYKAQEDIHKFLVDSFARFRETHPSPNIFPMNWPTGDDINTLVWRSSGQFIYASTAQKYIQEDHANPMTRLQTILDLTKDPINRPFAELDALYSHIFRQVKDSVTVLDIMCIRICCSLGGIPIGFCESLLGLPQGGVYLALQGLSSVVRVNDGQYEAYHASLNDFLEHKHRSGDFYIYSNEICVRLCCLALEYIPKYSADIQLICCVHIAAKCMNNIKGPHYGIHKILSTFNLDIIFQFIVKMGKDYNQLLLLSCGSLFEWLSKEHQNLARSNNMIILQPFSQLQKWTLGQLERFQFDEPASRVSLDYLENVFLCEEAGLCLIHLGLVFNSWVAGCAPQTLTEDRIGQLMSQYCYYICNSAWLNLIRNVGLNLDSDEQPLLRQEVNLWCWARFFAINASPQIDRYLDIHHILELNFLTSAPELLKDFQIPNHDELGLVIMYLYHFLERVEKEFSCLQSPLNQLEEGTSPAEQQAMDRLPSLPYIPYPSDSATFTLALTFYEIHHIEYQDTELVLPIV